MSHVSWWRYVFAKIFCALRHGMNWVTKFSPIQTVTRIFIVTVMWCCRIDHHSCILDAG